MSQHAPLAPSAAERWMACPGSHLAEAAAPPAPASEFADFGTAAHVLFAKALRFGLAAEAVTTDPLVLRPLALALDAARQILGRDPFLVELRFPALTGLGAVWGTADVVGFSSAGPVDKIVDLKFGENIAVEADTPQLGIYAMLAARCFGVAPGGVTAWVLQPRCAHAAGPARRHHYSRADLDRLETTVREAAAAANEPDAPRYAGEWCRWCAAAPTCPARQAMPDAVPPAVSNFFRPRPQWL
jgi:hypothetical protein